MKMRKIKVIRDTREVENNIINLDNEILLLREKLQSRLNLWAIKISPIKIGSILKFEYLKDKEDKDLIIRKGIVSGITGNQYNGYWSMKVNGFLLYKNENISGDFFNFEIDMDHDMNDPKDNSKVLYYYEYSVNTPYGNMNFIGECEEVK